MPAKSNIGHNGLDSKAAKRLQDYAARVTRLTDDKAAIGEDMKEVFAEAKGEGFDVKILRKAITLHRKDKSKRDEEETLIDLYLDAIEGTSGL